MVNYTFIDTGPPIDTKQRKPGNKILPRLTPVSKQPGSPPLRYEEQSPPSFFEQGNRTRWLLLILPFCYTAYRYQEISPFQFTHSQFYEFYIILSLCCAFLTHIALKAKRRKLINLLYTEPTAYYLEKIRRAYNKPTNTILASFLCTLTGVIKSLQELFAGNNVSIEISYTLFTTFFFILLYKANGYNKCVAVEHSHQQSLKNFFNFKYTIYE